MRWDKVWTYEAFGFNSKVTLSINKQLSRFGIETQVIIKILTKHQFFFAFYRLTSCRRLPLVVFFRNFCVSFGVEYTLISNPLDVGLRV